MNNGNKLRNLSNFKEFHVIIIAILAAGVLSAHQGSQFSGFNIFSSYLYWTCRVLIELATFSTILFAFEKYLHRILSKGLIYCCSILISLIPFTLLITAFDIILGLPELGIYKTSNISSFKGDAFTLELFYLLDNHMLLCLLFLFPRLLSQGSKSCNNTIESNVLSNQKENQKKLGTVGFFDELEPLMIGDICSLEAQEHYIQITTTVESRMVLHRFSDAVRRISLDQGMQVHRSHWVAHKQVDKIIVEGQSMKLILLCGKIIPVSRTFRSSVQKKYDQQ